MAEINYDKCMARTWNLGLGAQCSRNPVEESDYCSLHLKKSEIRIFRIQYIGSMLLIFEVRIGFLGCNT